MAESVQSGLGVIREEVAAALTRVEVRQVEALAEAVVRARRVFVAGEGRSGLVGRCFAMRLAHLGLQAYVVGETVSPAAGPGDLLLAVSASGTTRVTMARVEAARAHGVTLAVISAETERSRLTWAQVAVLLSAGPSQQFGGSLFEQTALLVLDALALALQQRLGQSKEEMQARHATVE